MQDFAFNVNERTESYCREAPLAHSCETANVAVWNEVVTELSNANAGTVNPAPKASLIA